MLPVLVGKAFDRARQASLPVKFEALLDLVKQHVQLLSFEDLGMQQRGQKVERLICDATVDGVSTIHHGLLEMMKGLTIHRGRDAAVIIAPFAADASKRFQH